MARPLQRRQPGRLAALVGLLLFGYPLFDAVSLVAPSVVTDWQIRRSAQPSSHYRIEDVSCRSLNLMFQLCNVALTHVADERLVVRPIQYAFFAPYSRSVAFRVLADPQHPEWATTDVGVEHLGNRTICLLLGLLVLVPLTLGSLALLLGVKVRPAPS